LYFLRDIVQHDEYSTADVAVGGASATDEWDYSAAAEW